MDGCICKKYIYQEERDESGIVRIRGYIETIDKVRVTQLQKTIERAKWEKSKNSTTSIEYYNNGDMYNGGIRKSFGVTIKFIPSYDEPYGWQLDIMDMINKPPDHKTVVWIYDPIGNTGKSQLCRYLSIKDKAYIFQGSKSMNIHHLAKTIKYNRKNNLPEIKVVCWDIFRCIGSKISYTEIERIKDGILTSTKYRGVNIAINNVHMIIFSNYLPL